MYDPVQDGIEKSVHAVHFCQVKPPADLANFAHCFWEIKTNSDLSEEFFYHALPDACVNILWNQLDTSIAGVTALRTKSTVLNLGKSFHYVGVQFFPGVWQCKKEPLLDCFVGTDYSGKLPLISVNNEMMSKDFASKLPILANLVRRLIRERVVGPNAVTSSILAHLDQIRSVTDMAHLVNLSPRQLQRTLLQATGLAPHDFLKVLRLQQSFKHHYLDFFADQSHFIHSFRKATGYTPQKFDFKFNV
jgi:AraC-like DNA-binding protein